MAEAAAIAQRLADLEVLLATDAEKAQEGAQTLLQELPQSHKLWEFAGRAALRRGDLPLASECLVKALQLNSNDGDTWFHLGELYLKTAQFDQAAIAAERAIRHRPEQGKFHLLRGRALLALDQNDQAITALQQAARSARPAPEAHLHLATVHLANGDIEAALAATRSVLNSTELEADAHFLLGDIFARRKDYHRAIVHWRQAAINPALGAQAYCNLGLLFDELKQPLKAMAAYEDALAVDPDCGTALSQLVFLKRELADWRDLPALSARTIDAVRRDLPGITPFAFLAEDAGAAAQHRCARNYALRKLREIHTQSQTPFNTTAHGRPKVGFVSSGFNNHPTALLTMELIEKLRGGMLETFGYATARDDGGALRQRISVAFWHFRDIHALSHAAMADVVRQDRIDILIDLRGYGAGSVTELFALRPAPLQINWLAYPGTSGAPFMDYIVADAFTIPDNLRQHYSEALIRLPYCFQPSDTTRKISPGPEKTSYGLPAQGMVFASFNNTYKINPEVFSCWMQILSEVPNSALWLLAGKYQNTSGPNLHNAARERGIDPARIVFQEKLPHDRYLQCYRHADLFLDAWPYGAHTTASDALWADCPVLTLAQDAFASRVAGSLLTTLDLPELIAYDRSAYQAKAVALGNNPSALLALKQKLIANKARSPLFDMAGFAKRFEQAMLIAHRRAVAGTKPSDFDVN